MQLTSSSSIFGFNFHAEEVNHSLPRPKSEDDIRNLPIFSCREDDSGSDACSLDMLLDELVQLLCADELSRELLWNEKLLMEITVCSLSRNLCSNLSAPVVALFLKTLTDKLSWITATLQDKCLR